MAGTIKRPDAARKLKSTEANKTASAEAASTKAQSTIVRSAKARSAKAGPAKVASAKAAAHILPAAKGPRTVSHRKIKEAVDKVFRERSQARA